MPYYWHPFLDEVAGPSFPSETNRSLAVTPPPLDLKISVSGKNAIAVVSIPKTAPVHA